MTSLLDPDAIARGTDDWRDALRALPLRWVTLPDGRERIIARTAPEQAVVLDPGDGSRERVAIPRSAIAVGLDDDARWLAVDAERVTRASGEVIELARSCTFWPRAEYRGVTSMALHPSGRFVAVIDRYQGAGYVADELELWEVATGRSVPAWAECFEAPIDYRVAMGEDACLVWYDRTYFTSGYGSAGGPGWGWNLFGLDGALRESDTDGRSSFEPFLQGIAIDPGGRWLVTAYGDSYAYRRELVVPSSEATLPCAPIDRLGLIDVARDGTTVSLVEATLYVLPPSDELGYRERALDWSPHAAALSPSGDRVALLGEGARIELVSTRDLPRP